MRTRERPSNRFTTFRKVGNTVWATSPAASGGRAADGPADRIALMRAWFREGMLTEQKKKPPLHDDFEPLLSAEE